eukprot:3455486-Pleurochrysis_carterae.AAC.2
MRANEQVRERVRERASCKRCSQASEMASTRASEQASSQEKKGRNRLNRAKLPPNGTASSQMQSSKRQRNMARAEEKVVSTGNGESRRHGQRRKS